MGIHISIKGGLILFGFVCMVFAAAYNAEYGIDRYSSIFWIGVGAASLGSLFVWFGKGRQEN